MWVLLEFYNGRKYEQHGGCFAGMFDSYDQALNSVDHIGRRNYENVWYEVRQYEKNVVIDEEERDTKT